ncbi:alpha/beta hydrolase [Kocuria coralli]|uniref:Alpha/beta hydrolase n=1 Tax=Kocuria coralli TaxID=1461025 RepID=A0A5J5KU63_9MICC|nr:alpha/beta hydrolase [Kocuria coralli]KAA9393203.1 alpha/beta hydrolase [Kocuria coralli]
MAYLQINGEELYSEVQGSGDPVLLLHGGFCSLESLQEQADSLADTYRVLAFERPGHGRSADIDGEYSYERGVAEALAYLDAQGLESAHVVGYSDGAIIGLLLARDHPHRLRSLVAISANLDPSAFDHALGRGNPPAVEPSTTEIAPGRDSEESGAGNGTDTNADPDAEVDAGLDAEIDIERARYDRLSPDGPEHADTVLGKLSRLWETEPRIDPAGLAEVSVPTLVMSGDHDVIRPDHSLLIASSIPEAQLCILPGATHGLVAERPGLISLVIRQFLAESGR